MSVPDVGAGNFDRNVAVVYHEDYLLHEHTPTHPERRERLTYTMDQLHEEGVFEHPAVELVEPERLGEKDMERVHTRAYIDELKGMSSEGHGTLSPDTHVSEHTWESALLAAGGVSEGVERVLDGETDASFVMSRPGGHHAFADDGHGFCFTNNTALIVFGTSFSCLKAAWDFNRLCLPFSPAS
jgi:acetoin utilization deacetylase AcuC-like enzyme